MGTGLLPDLRGLRVYAAMQLAEAHNSLRRAQEEQPILLKEMRQYLVFCRDHLVAVRIGQADTRAALHTLVGTNLVAQQLQVRMPCCAVLL